jgi:hypothetical protein
VALGIARSDGVQPADAYEFTMRLTNAPACGRSKYMLSKHTTQWQRWFYIKWCQSKDAVAMTCEIQGSYWFSTKAVKT